MSGRAAVFLIATMALAPGLLVNVLLKDHWGRSRPIDVTQFGGDERFVAWWDPRGDCPAIAHSSPAMSPVRSGRLRRPRWRRRIGARLPMARRSRSAAGMAAIRMMAGAHFPSDVIFAGMFTFLVFWLDLRGYLSLAAGPDFRTTRLDRTSTRFAGPDTI